MKTKFISFILLSAFLMLGFGLSRADAQTYCTPTYNSTNYYRIEGTWTTNGISNFSNLNNGNSNTGYSNFTSYAVMESAGGSFTLHSNCYGTSKWKVYIDWNDDGDFYDAGENVYSYNSYISSITTTINIPGTVSSGNYRMRVMANWGNTIYSPCTANYYLETEDYTITIAGPCSGTPNAGTGSTTAVCSGDPFSLSTTGMTIASGMTYQWQSSPGSANTWTDISGATASNLSVPTGITTATDYRLIVTCTSSSQSDTSGVIQVTINPPTQCYCVPSTQYQNYYITNVITYNGSPSNINNYYYGTSFTSPGYSDYSATDSVSVQKGNSTNFRVYWNYNYSYYFNVWIDWNQDGDFDDNGETIYNNTYTPYSSSYYGSITVPNYAATGRTRMRIRIGRYNSVGSPCSQENYGETEDYTFVVKPYPPCTSVPSYPSSATAAVSGDSFCVTGDFTLSLPSTSIPYNVTYQWQSAPSSTGPWTDIGTGQGIAPLSMFGVDTSTWYRCQVKCGNTVKLTSNTVNVYVNSPQVIGIPDSTLLCGPDSVTFTGSASAGNYLEWYASATSATVLDTGNTYTTPYLTSSDTFYVLATAGHPEDSAWLGNLNSYSSSTYTPFYTGFDGHKTQLLYRASELQAQGLTAGNIMSIALKTNYSSSSTPSLTNFTVKIGTTSATQLSSSWETGLTTVYTNTSYDIQANAVNTFTFSTPYYWDGVSNIVIETCFNNPSYGGYTYTYYTYQSFNAVHYDVQDNNTNYCSNPAGYGGTYYYRADMKFNIQSGCLGARQPVRIKVVPPGPVVDLGINNICPGLGATVIDAENAGDYFLWNTGDTTQTISTLTQGTFSVTVTDSNGCFGSDTTIVGMGVTPVSNMPNPVLICSGLTDTLDALNSGSSYLWNTGDTTQTLAVDSNANYIVAITSTTNCTVSDTTDVIILPLPTADLGADTIFCWGDTISLNPGGYSGNSFLWNTNATTQSIMLSDSGLYHVAVTDSNGCIKRDTVMIHESVISPVSLLDTTNICYGDTAILDAGNPGTQYMWSTSDTTQTITSATIGNYSVMITNGMGCVRTLKTYLWVQLLPKVDLGNDTAICKGASIILNPGTQPASSSFLWTTAETTPTVTATDTGYYGVVVTDYVGCIGWDSVYVARLRGARVNGLTASLDSFSGHYSYAPQGDRDAFSYYWDFGDGNTSTEVNPTHLYASSGNYQVMLVVTNPCGSDTVTAPVHYYVTGLDKINLDLSQLQLYPNPAQNQITLKNVSQYKMASIQVYNILGQEIFRNETNNTKMYRLNTSSYASGMYQIRINFENGHWINRKFEIRK